MGLWESVGACKSEAAFPPATGCLSPDLAQEGAASRAGPEAALVSWVCIKAGGTSSPTSHQVSACVSARLRFPALSLHASPGTRASAYAALRVSTCVFPRLCLHSLWICLCESLATGARHCRCPSTHTHVGFYFCTCLFLHVDLWGSQVVPVSRCLCSEMG